MGLVETASMAATLLGGLVSLIVLLSAIADVVTGGWVRHHVRSWLNLDRLRRDHHNTQVFLGDLGEAHNNLARVVCEHHDAGLPDKATVDTSDYERRLDAERVQRGDFLRGGE